MYMVVVKSAVFPTMILSNQKQTFQNETVGYIYSLIKAPNYKSN